MAHSASASLPAASGARLKSKWNDELAQWRSRPLDDLEVVYMWVDGVYVKAGLEKEKAAVLVVMAALSDGSKVVVSTVPGYRESTESWSEVLRDIKRRGLSCPRLVVGDGHLGIWGALRNVYPQAAEQRCWNHKIVNVLAKLPKRQQDQAKLMLRTIPYAPTRTEAERLRTVFTRWCGDHSYEAASEALERDWDRMVTFYDSCAAKLSPSPVSSRQARISPISAPGRVVPVEPPVEGVSGRPNEPSREYGPRHRLELGRRVLRASSHIILLGSSEKLVVQAEGIHHSRRAVRQVVAPSRPSQPTHEIWDQLR